MKNVIIIAVLICVASVARADTIGNTDTANGRSERYQADKVAISAILASEIAENLDIDSLYIYCEGLTSADLKGVLYADNSGAPGDTIATTAATDLLGTSRQWYGFAISASLTASTQYWVGSFASGPSNASKTQRGSDYGEWLDETVTWPSPNADGSGATATTGSDTLMAVCVYLVGSAAGEPGDEPSGRRRKMILIGGLTDEALFDFVASRGGIAAVCRQR